MRVDLRTYGTEPADNGKTSNARPAPTSSERENAPVTLDRARFSFDQTRVRTLEREVLAQPEVRQQRVELLRQSLGKGEYAVSDGQVADALLADLSSGGAGQPAG
jgi:flagellar biosynthesis anti-sigma factor FlgM